MTFPKLRKERVFILSHLLAHDDLKDSRPCSGSALFDKGCKSLFDIFLKLVKLFLHLSRLGVSIIKQVLNSSPFRGTIETRFIHGSVSRKGRLVNLWVNVRLEPCSKGVFLRRLRVECLRLRLIPYFIGDSR